MSLRMEDILLSQAEITTAIEKLLSNFKREGYTRRYATAGRKLEELTTLFTDFQLNHTRLCQFGDKNHEYFTGKHFESTKQFYLDAVEFINKHLKGEEEQQKKEMPTVPTPNINPRTIETNNQQSTSAEQQQLEEIRETLTNSLDEKLRRQAANYKAFQRTISNINIETITERWEFEDTLKKLESRWTTIDSLHWEIESELGSRDNEGLESLYNTYETQYNNIKKNINKRMWSEKHRDQTTPHLEVPTFSGNYNQWVSFKDLFSEAIHKNPSLSKAQKMQFLKSKVRGEAERLIQHLSISSDNYLICWEILNHRYNNKKLIFSSHINTLLDLPSMKHQSMILIKRMHDVTIESLNAVKNLGVNIATWDPLIVHILDQKLDAESHSEYIESLKDRRELPVLKDFLDFLEGKFTAMESARRKGDNYQQQSRSYNNQHQQPSTSYGKVNNSWNNGSKLAPKSTFNIISGTFTCPLCSNEHGLYNCRKFLELSADQKLKTVRELRVCMNCLFSHHGNDCTSNKTCRKCTKKHSTLLHDAFIKTAPPRSNLITAQQDNNINNSSHVSQLQEQNPPVEVLLSTAMIRVKAADGTYHNMRALIDAGSQVSLITERAAQFLNVKRQRCKGTVFGIGEKENSGKGLITIECSSICSDFRFQTEVIIMNNLIGNLPNKTFKKPDWPLIENISLADPEFYISRPVDILFGADVYSFIILSGLIKGEDLSQPVVQQTRLGWLLCGGAKTYRCNVLLHNLDEIQKFWEVEEINEESQLSVEDQKCIDFYMKTTRRLEDGRYEVRLPLKENITDKLGSSKQSALAQFRSLEKKFHKQPKLENDYKTFMQEYESMGHMKPISDDATLEHYLPHHGVENLNSTTTKYRVVFNASHKTSTGYSLNDLMHTGPNLQTDLQMLLLSWRQFRYGWTADISKMFRMILVNEEDQKFQAIHWRYSSDTPIKSYVLTTVTYGTRPAPFLSMMTLRKLAADERDKYPEAAEIVEKAFFMDDVLYGSENIEYGQKLIADLISLMKSGGFDLRKWSSNEDKILEHIKTQNSKSEDNIFTFKTDTVSKTLGLCWDSSQDQFNFQYKPPQSTHIITKRVLLSEISKIFDPLGWMAPLTTKLKILFQKLWKYNLKWDNQIPEDMRNEWMRIKNDLPNINEYKVPRWIQCYKKDVVELHGFCDASMEAYACVVYARVKGQTKLTLVAGKTKLVPHKREITLPRLELLGAHLLSKLVNKIKQALSEHKLELYGWTDSMVVLGWLQGEPNRWKAFVANRVNKITEILPGECWRYVKSEENPADAASRGLYAHQLKEHTMWWNGPEWLSRFEEKQQLQTYTTEEEMKKLQSNFIQEKDIHLIDNLLNNYSTFNKTVRVLTWIMRAFTLMRKQLPPYLTFQEIATAKTIIVKHVQRKEFRAEIDSLMKFNKVDRKSKVLNLHPFIDKSGLLRVGGRLENSTLSMEVKHPKIIPRNSRLTELLIIEAHLHTFHGGPRLTLANLRQQYWIPGGLGIVKKHLRNCVTCRKNDPVKQHQLMGELPVARTEPAPPFFHCGTDYTGFIDIKANKTRNAASMKGYIALFICMVTKAIHLELVTDLSSSAFLAALRRMSARRGAPRHIYSDCGTNFVGANNILQEEIERIKQKIDNNLIGILESMNITWHFNVPCWASAVGIWERAVRSVKFHLKRVIGAQRLTFEEYTTLLAQVEACLNSRPLCALTENIDDLECLTPAHFLTGRAGVTIIETAEDARTRWHLTNDLFKQIWKKWRLEYLTELNTRNKWRQPQRNIQIGDLVTIQDENLPPGKWLMARVVELHPGKDGYVRVVTLKTQKGFTKRPIVKLCVLPLDPKQHESEKTRLDLPQTSNRKRNDKLCNSTLYTVAMALLFFMSIVSNATGTNITNLNENQALYFDPLAKLQYVRDQWTLVAYYNMSPYWEGTTALERLLDYLGKTCNRLETDNKCNMIMPQLIHECAELHHYNELLLTQHFLGHSRQRRGLINVVGSLANTLFGVLDQQFAEQYTRDIQLINKNQAHLRQLWNNQTSIVESEYNLIKRTEEIMNKQHKIINKHLNNLSGNILTLQGEVNKVRLGEDFAISALTASSMLQHLKSIQNVLLDTISDIFHGQFNLHLLPPQQLQQQFNIISGLLKGDVTLPVDIYSNVQQVYKILKVKARMTEKYFLFEIRIPLICREIYDLYNIIPIPKMQENSVLMISPVSEYVAINLQRDSYVPVSGGMLEKCIIRDSSLYMCLQHDPIYKMKADSDLCISNKDNICETSKTECKNMWIGLAKVNTYLYFCCERCPLRTICGDQVTAHELERANIISLEDDCVIKANDFTIHGHKRYQSQLSVLYNIETPVVTSINHIINITINKEEQEDGLNETEQLYKEMDNKMKSMKNAMYDSSNAITSHDVHQYIMIYLVVGVMIMTFVIIIWRRSTRSWSRPRNNATTSVAGPAPVEVELEPRPAPRQPVFNKIVFQEDSA